MAGADPSRAGPDSSQVGPFRRKARSKPRRILSYLVPLAFAGFLGAFLWSRRDELEPLGEASILSLVAIGALVTVAHVLNSTEFWLLYRAESIRTGVVENAFLFFANNLANYMPGQAGTVYRLEYMRVVHDAPYSLSAAVYGGNLIATLAGAAAAGVTGTLVLALERGVAWWMLGIYIGIAALAVAFMFVPLPRFVRREGRLARAWNSFHAGFGEIRGRPRLALCIVGIEVVKYTVTALRFQVAFSLLDFHEPYWFFLAIAPAAGLAQFVSFTPGAIGLREGFLAAASVALGSPLSTGLLAATVDRAVMLATSMVLGSLGFAVTYPRLRRARRVGPSLATSAT